MPKRSFCLLDNKHSETGNGQEEEKANARGNEYKHRKEGSVHSKASEQAEAHFNSMYQTINYS